MMTTQESVEETNSKSTSKNGKVDFTSWLGLPIYLKLATGAFGLLLILSIYTVFLNIQLINRQRNAETSEETIALLSDRAEHSINSAELILSFLEGAAILVGIIAGAAALYGFGELSKLSDLRKEIDQKRGLLEELDQLKGELENRINNVGLLLQADQEFRLGNYQESAFFAQQVLQKDDDNLMAIYLLGWLKVQHLRHENSLEEGIELLEALQGHVNRLKQEFKKNKRTYEWATAQAAYGVALRKKGRSLINKGEHMQAEDPERAKKLKDEGTLYLENAVVQLQSALNADEKLMDFNSESYWGPVGGIRRDLGHIELAIQAYKEALKITPLSSYPQGNIAALEVRLAQSYKSEPAKYQGQLETAKKAFAETIKYANVERVYKPYDYYLLMDLAMAYGMLGDVQEAEKHFDEAMNLKPNMERMLTSYQAGWGFLDKYCPDEWHEVKEFIGAVMNKMNFHMAEEEKRQNESAKQTLPS